jgi:PAS domain S-box-containing protein
MDSVIEESAAPSDDAATPMFVVPLPGWSRMTEKRSTRRLEWVVRVCGVSAASIGAIWLVLQQTSLPARWSAAGVITVKPNMALGLTLGAVSLLLLADQSTAGARRWTGAALAAIVLLIGGLTLSEHVFGFDLGIDQILATEQPGAAGTAAPNRMGPPGSLSMTLLGAALLAVGVGRRRWAAPYLALAVCLVNMAPLVGYLYGATEFYSKPHLTGIAWPTVTAMLALALGVIASVRKTGPTLLLIQDDLGGLMLRRLLPAVVLIPLILGWLRVQGQYRGWYDTPAGTAWLILAMIVLFAALLWRNAASLSRSSAASKTAEAALRESEELLRLAHEAACIGAFEWNVQTGVNIWTPKLEQLYGLAVGSFGRTQTAWENLVHPDDRAVIAKHVTEAFETNGPGEAEFRVIWPDGSVHWLTGRWQGFKDASGAPLRLTGVNIDITERKQAEERLWQTQKLESLGVLAGGIAHDFNNLLVGVIGNASLAHEMLPPDHPVTELIETVVKTAEQAAHLTRQMLAYSGKGKFLVESLDLSAVAREIFELVHPSISKKIVMNLELDGDLPAIEADRGQVQQILMSLAINATEAIGSHYGQVTFMTGARVVDGDYLRRHPEAADLQPGHYVVLEVRDTGCGMDGAIKTKIFDPFFSTKFTGRGLGLAAVAGIVRGHKGAIVVTSAPGKGSMFTVLFPSGAHPAKGQPDVRPSAAAQGSGVVLVIDDEQVVRDMAQRALERYGYTVLVADGGLAAINILKRHPGRIDLAVLDLSMPGMSGAETLPELRKIRPEMKVFVSSGYSETEAMTMFRGQRISGFLQKPYTFAVLGEKVTGALG